MPEEEMSHSHPCENIKSSHLFPPSQHYLLAINYLIYFVLVCRLLKTLSVKQTVQHSDEQLDNSK
jgi:hypothetical protein